VRVNMAVAMIVCIAVGEGTNHRKTL